MSPNCIKCKHYFITFDQSAPKGCRVYNIKSQRLPSIIVKDANQGRECIGFEPKPVKEKKEKNLNDDKYWK
jgi:protein-arginine kinase activator protein McsA